LKFKLHLKENILRSLCTSFVGNGHPSDRNDETESKRRVSWMLYLRSTSLIYCTNYSY